MAEALDLDALGDLDAGPDDHVGMDPHAEGDGGGAGSLVLLAHHRFGRGRVALLAARDSWRWRMHADVAPDDRTHELFWRRLLRWLARDVPGRVEVSAAPRVAAPGQPVSVSARVRDPEFRSLDSTTVEVLRTTPVGGLESRRLLPGGRSGQGAGVVFTPRETGGHELRVSLPAEGGPVHGDAGFLVDAGGGEFRRAALDEGALRALADATGGSYRHLSEATGLADAVRATAPRNERLERVTLWNAPALLLALLALACGEWWQRRRRRRLP